jgi:AcrR family transcriptional regulator
MTAAAPRRTGRRAGREDTRGAILAAARTAFAERGYHAATVRSIAASAGVDPALVHHFFGTKEGVFVAAMDLPLDPGTVVAQLTAGGIEGLGERLVRMYLEIWNDPERRQPFLALLRSATSGEDGARMLRQFIEGSILGRVAADLGLKRSSLGLAAVASQVVGLVVMRYVVRLEPLASAGDEEIVAIYGPTFQRYVEAAVPTSRESRRAPRRR